MKKIIIAIIILTLLACGAIILSRSELFAPETTDTSSQPTTLMTEKTSTAISLGYYKGKPFNPYTTKSPTNLKISTLLYDSLFILNDDWSVKELLVSEYANSGTELTVKIIDDAVFSNGATLSAYDVVYSFNLAKKSNFFKGRLANFLSAAVNTNEVIFTLKQPDNYAEYCLTFPIVQNNTGTAALPVGSGRYILVNNQGNFVLTENATCTRGEKLATAQINLVPINSEDNQVYLIQTGDLSYFYDDMASGKVKNINANTAVISTNTLIYLGLNGNSSFFSEKGVATALCYSIDKSVLSDTVFDNICTITSVPFNPNWHILKNMQLPYYEHNIIKGGELLDQSGYSFSGTAEQYRSDGGSAMSMSLIVNEESTVKVNCAKLIAEDLKLLGIKVTTEALPFADYTARLKEGDFDMYIGEIKLSPNMDLSSFFTKNGSTSFGISPSSTISKAYNDFKTGNIDVATFIQVFSEEKPFIPLCYKGAMTYYSKDIFFEGTGNEYDPFRHIYTWSNSRSSKTPG